MRDYKQMQEIQKLKQQAADDATEASADSAGDNGKEAARYSHRSPGFRGWVQYLAEYYKWPILIGLVIIIGVGIGIAQVNRVSNPDLCAMYVGPYYLPPVEQEHLKTSFATLAGENAGDYNADGEFRLDFLDITVTHLTDADGIQYTYDDQNTAYMRFQTELRAGDTLLYFLEPYYYRQAKAENILLPLETLGMDESLSFDGYGIYLGELESYELAGLNKMPADTVVCLRRSPEHDAIDYGRTIENWEHHRDLLLQLIAYRSPSAPTPAKGEPDVTLLFVGEQTAFRSIRLPLEAMLSSLTPDTNADGVNIGSLRAIPRFGTTAELRVRAKEIRTELVTGDCMLYLLDPEAFAYASSHGLLEKLPDGLQSRDAAVDGCGLKLSGLKLAEADGFCGLPANSILCLRRNPAAEPESYGRTEADFEAAKTVFLKLAAYSGSGNQN